MVCLPNPISLLLIIVFILFQKVSVQGAHIKSSILLPLYILVMRGEYFVILLLKS